MGLQNLSLLDAVDLERLRSATLLSFGFRNAAELIDAAFQLFYEKVVPLLDAERFTNLFQNSTAETGNCRNGSFVKKLFEYRVFFLGSG